MGGYYGPYRALVVNSSDPESLNRIQVQIPQLMGVATSGWAYPIPADAWGVPPVGSQVLVTFEGGDLCHPLYFADSTGVSQAYIDNGDSTTLASSKTYADSGDATTLASAKSYADSGDATVQGNLNTHVAATTSVHGIVDTSKLVATTSPAATVGALPVPDAGNYFSTDTITGVQQYLGSEIGNRARGIDLTTIWQRNGNNWVSAINTAISQANSAGGGVIYFPQNTTITLSAQATALGAHVTLMIPRSCTIIKANGTYSNIFGLQTPTYPAYVDDVHIIGGTWVWTTSTDPGGDDGRGPIMFKYGSNVSVEHAVFNCLNTNFVRRTSGPYFAWCQNAKLIDCTVNDGLFGTTFSAQAAPDNTGRVMSGVRVNDCTFARTDTPTTTSNNEGVFVKGSYTSGYNVSDVTVRDNIIANYGMGIEIGPGDKGRAVDNVISNYVCAISMADISNARVRGNKASNSVAARTIAIEVTGCAHSKVESNQILDAGQTTAPGIGIYGSSSTRNSNYTDVEGNYIEGGSQAIQVIDNASECRAFGNIIKQAQVGIKVGPTGSSSTGNTTYNKIYGNVIDRPASGTAVLISTYSTYITDYLTVVNNVLGAATISGTVNHGTLLPNVTDSDPTITTAQISDATTAGKASLTTDTGWVNLTPASGYKANSDVPQVRQIGSVLYFRGTFGTSSGSNLSGTAVVGNIPSSISWPSVSVSIPLNGSTGTSPMRGYIGTDGSITVTAPVTGSCNYVSMSGTVLTG